jgi:hypothetical protein
MIRYLMGLCIRLRMLGTRECEVMIERYTAVVKGLAALISRIDDDLQSINALPTDGRLPKAESLKALRAES